MCVNRPAIKELFFVLMLLAFFTARVEAQIIQPDSLSADEVKAYKDQVSQLIAYLESTFNTIGDPKVPVKEKDIIITQSYLKIFRDEKVQVEDDLDEHREVVTNKDITAYLKDIGFFFKNVRFKFFIEQVDQEITETGSVYFKVTLNRNLQGVTLEGDSINNSMVRYMELNLDYDNQDLKIVSIYTTKLSEAGEAANWWNFLASGWKQFFIRTDTTLKYLMAINDSLTINYHDTIPGSNQTYFQRIKQLWGITDIDISGNLDMTSLDPLKKFTGLRNLTISNTLIDDLTPVRNLTKLERLNCSGTPVRNLQPLYYCTGIRELNISNTQIDNLDVITNLTHLTYMNCDNTMIEDLEAAGNLIELKELRCHNTLICYLSPLEDLLKLEVLDVSDCDITNLTPLKSLKGITFLNISNTLVTDLGSLRNLQNLQYLYMDYTPVSDLNPLMSLPGLRRVYCDHSQVSATEANSLNQAIPGILIVYDSGELTSWWMDLPYCWKKVFGFVVSLDSVPSREQLHEITQIHRIDISGDTCINDLHPLQKLNNLNELDCSGTRINSLEPVSENIHLQVINASATAVRNLDPLRNLASLKWIDISATSVTDLLVLNNLQNLEYLKVEHSGISDIMPLARLEKLESLYADYTLLDQENVNKFMDMNGSCMVIWQSERLKAWWNDLPEAWKNIFKTISLADQIPDTEKLHEMARLEEIAVNENKMITGLEPFEMFVRLKKIKVTKTPVSSLIPLAKLTRLTSIICSDNPVRSVAPIAGLQELKMLDISNTQVADMELLQTMTSLEVLNISGTPVKNLKFIETLVNLKELDIHNTRISHLKSLENLHWLKVLKCYNTGISSKQVDKFKNNHPSVEIVYY